MNAPRLKARVSTGPELDVNVQIPSPLTEEMTRQIAEWKFNIHEIPMKDLPQLCFGKSLYAAAMVSSTRLTQETWK